MTGQLNRVDVTVLPVGWLNRQSGTLPSEVSGSWSGTLSPDGRHAAYVRPGAGSEHRHRRTTEPHPRPLLGPDPRSLACYGLRVRPVAGI